MKECGIFEAKNRFSELCETVAREGEPLVVTRHGAPLVRIVPFDGGSGGASVWDTVKECRERYGPLSDEFVLPDRRVSENRPDPLA